MKIGTYLKLQLKRAFKIYPSVLIITAITICSIALTAGLIFLNNRNDDDNQKIKLGLVGDTKDTYLELGIAALKNLDSSRLSIEFTEMTEEKARKALENREISGYVLVPDNFINGVAYGENPKAKYIMLNGPEGFGTVLTSEITQTVSTFVTDAQSAIFSMSEIAEDYEADDQMTSKVNKMTLRYMDQILGRDKSYDTVLLGIEDSLSMVGYYICGIILFFLLLWGISCNKMLLKKNHAMSQLLSLRGMKTVSQILCEFVSFFAVTLVTFIILAIAFGALVTNNDFGIKELSGANIFTCILFVFKIVPVIIMITFMQMMLYELVSGTVSAVLLQFLVAVVFAYVSGCFYPNFFFPESIQNFANILPSGVGFSYMRKCLAGISLTSDLNAICIYTVAFAGITALMRKYRMAGDKA